MSSEEGYKLSLLTQLVAKSQKAAHKVLPKNPVDAVQMLRGCYEGQDELAEVESSAAESNYEDYRDVVVDSGCEWSQDEAFNAGAPHQASLNQDVTMADSAAEAFDAGAPQDRVINSDVTMADNTTSGTLEAQNAETLQAEPIHPGVSMADNSVLARDARNPIGALRILHLCAAF